MTAPHLVLSLFPGADLLGRAFETAGFCVVRGPDTLWGGDIHAFHVPPGRFDGIIGGPPCQVFSELTAMNGTDAVNLIPEYLRIVTEARPHWAIMENVPGARTFGPDWPLLRLRDWDVGGYTNRLRLFWFYGIPAAPRPLTRPGDPAWSVLASQWKTRTGKKGGTRGMYQTMTTRQASDLQGFPGLGERIEAMQPDGVSQAARRVLAIHMLGNGVPLAVGRYLARHVLMCTTGCAKNADGQLPLAFVADEVTP